MVRCHSSIAGSYNETWPWMAASLVVERVEMDQGFGTEVR